MTLLGNEVVITHDFPEMIGTKYFTVGRNQGHLTITVIFVQQFYSFQPVFSFIPRRHWAELPSLLCS